MSEYALDQAVRPVATAEPGRFTVELDDAWRALGGVVNGGYATAVCLRALLEGYAARRRSCVREDRLATAQRPWRTRKMQNG